MIENIEKTEKGVNLEVVVTCKIREYAKNPIILLTTKSLIDILNKEYKILQTLEEPTMSIGNSNVKKVSNVGKWVFKLDKAKKKRNATTSKAKIPPKTQAKSSIRSRMAKIANQKEEKD